MGTLSNYADWLARIANPAQSIRRSQAAISTTISGHACTFWKGGSPAGATITTAAAPTASTTGALRDPQLFDAAIASYLARVQYSMQSPGLFWLTDRLSHQGGLSGTLNGTDSSTNLPTAALTRHTSGEGVMASLEIYTQIGTTGQTFTISYTNQAGTSGRTSPAQDLGGNAFREVSRRILIPLQVGDTGVRSVESITTSGSTGTAGAYGITLFKPLAAISVPGVPSIEFIWDAVLNSGGVMPAIANGACLDLIWFGDAQGQSAAQLDFDIIDF